MVHISKMSGKLEGLLAINTNPLTNDFCQQMSRHPGFVCSDCYSRRMLSTYRKSCVPPFDRNAQELSSRVLDNKDLPSFKSNEIVRFNSHGELININHLHNIINICNKNSDTRFALWTKRATMVEDMNKPDNMVLIYSNPLLNDSTPTIPYPVFDKIFSVYTKGYIEASGMTINCANKCKECLLCYKKNDITSITEKLK